LIGLFVVLCDASLLQTLVKRDRLDTGDSFISTDSHAE
jgi:hypothetical protein